MRRRDREITDPQQLEEILRRAPFCRIALSDGEEPYLVPVCFGYEKGRIYVHSAAQGRKMDILRRNSRVCFEATAEAELIEGEKACGWSLRYSSVIGSGRAVVLGDGRDREEGLRILMAHYSDRTFDFSEIDPAPFVIIRIDVERMTGKSSKG